MEWVAVKIPRDLAERVDSLMPALAADPRFRPLAGMNRAATIRVLLDDAIKAERLRSPKLETP